MFTWLGSLPPILQVFIIFAGFLVIIILAFLGKVNIKLGKYNFNFGKAFKPISKTRNCDDCRKLVMIRTMKYDQDVRLVKDDILRNQMNYAEQKLHEIYFMLTTSYRNDMIYFRKPNEEIDFDRENKEFLLYQEILSSALIAVKGEIRRSFKENGFVELSNQEFSDYVKGKTKLLINIGREYVRSRYPFNTMIVPLEWRFSRIPEQQIEAAVFDLFSKAKAIKLCADEKIEQLGLEYDKDMIEFSDIKSSRK